jgi:hypothetical protein
MRRECETDMSAMTLPPTEFGAPVRKQSHDPSCVVQRAWSVLRLARLQELIGLTIVELQSLRRPVQLDASASGTARPGGRGVAGLL